MAFVIIVPVLGTKYSWWWWGLLSYPSPPLLLYPKVSFASRPSLIPLTREFEVIRIVQNSCSRHGPTIDNDDKDSLTWLWQIKKWLFLCHLHGGMEDTNLLDGRDLVSHDLNVLVQ
jgi:hypothetical protein